MDIQLNELIEKIKGEGIEQARAEGEKVKAEAEAEAQKILEDAKREAAAMTKKAAEEAERSEKAGKMALEQASRNLLLGFKDEVQGLLDRLVADAVDRAYSLDIVKAALLTIIKNWSASDTDALTVLLPENDLAKLDAAFRAELASLLKGGVTLKGAKNLEAGFQIVEKDGTAYYDFSATTVAEMLSSYLSPTLAEILKSQV
jgi:V/A-type H+-transporting ATPase subunit E